MAAADLLVGLGSPAGQPIPALLTTNSEALALLLAVPDTRFGDTLAAFIVLTDPDRPPQPEELRSFARSTLAGFKIPQYWYIVAELPLNSAGKVVRARLRAQQAC